MTTTTEVSLADFAKAHEITMSCDYANSNPNMADPDWQANHYKVTIHANGRQMITYYSQGLGISGEPTLESVLDCLAMDAASVENAGSFEDWAADFGYDEDSRKAERSYQVCQRQADKLNKLLGDAYTDLLWHVERL